nr:uncharacterized protein LOC111506208 [Leptinotarsa decemlineata]XP_023016989.1 uncharacterized protein LOC111506208 [Leptinotarsa decemlineata]
MKFLFFSDSPEYLLCENSSYNFIEKLAVSSKTYPNLTLLDLSFNSLELFAITSEIPMKKIDLTRNLLDDISVFKVAEVEELRLSLNEFTFTISRDIEQIYQKVRKISLYPNSWSCEVLSDIWKRLFQHNITLSNPEDDYRLAKQHETFPICLEVTSETRYNDEPREMIKNFRERGVKFLKDKHSPCNESIMCSNTEICRNRQCFNPCKEDVCDFTSLCRAEKHSFSCDCPRNQKRDPKDLYSRCYTVECFQDFDCPDYSRCDTKSHLCELSKEHNSKFHIDAVGNAVTKHNIQYISLSPPVARQHPWYYDKEDPALIDF